MSEQTIENLEQEEVLEQPEAAEETSNAELEQALEALTEKEQQDD